MNALSAFSLLGNSQRLDGGAMFGNAPRALWQRWIAPDSDNTIPLACRALLLIEPSGRRVLFETGIGAFFPPKLRARYGVIEPEHVLLDRLAAIGLSDDAIDVVVLSHLHFDHAGGLLDAWAEDLPPRLRFPKAKYLVGREAFSRAKQPHARDRASFIADLPALLEQSGRLELITTDRSALLGDRYRFHLSHGHTPGLLLTEIQTARGPLLYASDLVPGRAWVHAPITMGYDRFPELLIDEKTALLADLAARGGWLFFTHDPEIAIARVTHEGGRFSTSDEISELRGDPL
jgi:glyoxylase-like metal-dependent hydrolase (beta-lactamase superfamily II)